MLYQLQNLVQTIGCDGTGEKAEAKLIEPVQQILAVLMGLPLASGIIGHFLHRQNGAERTHLPTAGAAGNRVLARKCLCEAGCRRFVRDNMLAGYRLVVGLNGTGDTLSNSSFTKQSLVGMLERLVSTPVTRP